MRIQATMQPNIRYITNSSGYRLVVRQFDRSGLTIVFLGGFRSNMEGVKARAVEAFCRENDFSSLCFDYSGHGASEGDFDTLVLGDWVSDARLIINQCIQGDIVLVGSSMGAWISMVLAPQLSSLIGFFGIASAPDFTERNLLPVLTIEQKKSLDETGTCYMPSSYESQGYPVSKKLLSDARKYLLLDSPIKIEQPVCLVHGQQDQDIPWETSIELMRRLTSSNVQCHLIKSGDHRLSRSQDIYQMTRLLASFVGELTTN